MILILMKDKLVYHHVRMTECTLFYCVAFASSLTRMGLSFSGARTRHGTSNDDPKSLPIRYFWLSLYVPALTEQTAFHARAYEHGSLPNTRRISRKLTHICASGWLIARGRGHGNGRRHGRRGQSLSAREPLSEFPRASARILPILVPFPNLRHISSMSTYT